MIELVSKVKLPSDVYLNERELCDIELLLSGALKPLSGFMGLDDFMSVATDMRLAESKYPWTLPICLPVRISDCVNCDHAEPCVVNIRDQTNSLIATIDVVSVYKPDLHYYITKVLGDDMADGVARHPFAKVLVDSHSDCYYIGGKVTKREGVVRFDFRKRRMSPEECIAQLKLRGCANVVGFQTRNPMHRSHFELTRNAVKTVEESTGSACGLLISPAVGPTQPGDVDYRTRIRCYEAILSHYEVEPVLCLLPLAMRMAGPREAVLHAQIRKNYGCTHFIVGRDHAGPSTKMADGNPFYAPYDAQTLVKHFSDEIGIQPVFSSEMVYCGEELGYMQTTDVPAGVSTMNISGTRFRQMLEAGEDVPSWFCFPDVVKHLTAAYTPRHKKGLVVYFTGLPCSGKSTLANALEGLLLENNEETRRVTVLDADIIRKNLTKGLGFSQEDRSLNVRRIGYVASEIAKHGGICLVANIAPYSEDRAANRRLIECTGGSYVEVYVSTPLDVCEKRDIKEFYQKARAGIIKQFTGISDPYEAPQAADITLNSSDDLMGKVRELYTTLKDRSYC